MYDTLDHFTVGFIFLTSYPVDRKGLAYWPSLFRSLTGHYRRRSQPCISERPCVVALYIFLVQLGCSTYFPIVVPCIASYYFTMSFCFQLSLLGRCCYHSEIVGTIWGPQWTLLCSWLSRYYRHFSWCPICLCGTVKYFIFICC